MKNDHLTEEIKSRLDIVDLISEHVDLKRSGQNYKGLCPFHSEKTPSFTVSQSKQIFHCFGCHKGGDIFAFVMNYENMAFQEAISYLADKAGVKYENLQRGSGFSSGLKESVLAIHRQALDFYVNNLKGPGQAPSYIKERGLDNETVKKFSLGCSKKERDALLVYLKANGSQPDQIKASGLVYFGENGTHDFFRDRLMFPIFDLQGRPIAFGGRILSASKNAPKYINSPDTVIFKKGESIYGLDVAKNTIVQKGYSIIVEGYLDVIICHQYGFDNAVAPLGTALTPGHLKKLSRFSNKVLLIFDGDPAGLAATKRSLELVFAAGMVAKVLLLPEGEDPDTLLRKQGEEYFRKSMGRAMSPVQFLLKVYGKNKLDAVRSLLHILSACPDPLQKEETLKELTDRAGINELTLREELKNIGQKNLRSESRRHPGDVAVPGISAQGLTISREEEILLSIALSRPEKIQGIMSGLDIEKIENHTARGIFEKINNVVNDTENGQLSQNKLLSVCSPEEQGLITKLSINMGIDGDQVDRNISDCLKKIAINKLEKQIKMAETAGNDEKLLQYLRLEKSKLISGKVS